MLKFSCTAVDYVEQKEGRITQWDSKTYSKTNRIHCSPAGLRLAKVFIRPITDWTSCAMNSF